MIYKSFLFAKLHKFELFNQVMSIKEKYNGITFNSYLWERYKELTSLKCVWGFELWSGSCGYDKFTHKPTQRKLIVF